MGLFDTIMIDCPMCGASIEWQVKPVLEDGAMGRWDIKYAPDVVLRNASYDPEECECGCVLQIVDGHNDGWMLRIARDVKLEHLPVRVQFFVGDDNNAS